MTKSVLILDSDWMIGSNFCSLEVKLIILVLAQAVVPVASSGPGQASGSTNNWWEYLGLSTSLSSSRPPLTPC